MSEHSITFDQWTACEEALGRLKGAVATLMVLWEHVESGECFSRQQEGRALYFTANGIEREIMGCRSS